MSANTSHVDENQQFSIIGVVGTAGTADTQGTALTLPIGVDPSTGAAYVYNLGPAGTVTPAGTQDVNIVGGTITTTAGNIPGGTIDLLKSGSVVVTAGTTTISGTVPISGTVTSTPGNSSGGTLDLVKTIGTVNNIAGGSIVVTAGTVTTTIANSTGGTLDLLKDGTISTILNAGTIQQIKAGTITSVGTIPGIGIIGNLNGGSVVVTAGTIGATSLTAGTLQTLGTVGTVGNINGGSIVVTAGTIASVGTVPGVGVVAAITTGTIANSGTATGVGVVGNINGGTISILTNGTLSNSGTSTGVGVIGNVNGGSIVVTTGTVLADGRTSRDVLSFATTFAGTAAAYGTMIGSAAVGAGTHVWINDVSIVNNSGTLTASVGFGTVLNGSNIIAKGNFGPQGGIQKSFPKAVNCGSANADLTCYISAAGTVDFNVSYFISA